MRGLEDHRSRRNPLAHLELHVRAAIDRFGARRDGVVINPLPHDPEIDRALIRHMCANRFRGRLSVMGQDHRALEARLIVGVPAAVVPSGLTPKDISSMQHDDAAAISGAPSYQMSHSPSIRLSIPSSPVGSGYAGRGGRPRSGRHAAGAFRTRWPRGCCRKAPDGAPPAAVSDATATGPAAGSATAGTGAATGIGRRRASCRKRRRQAAPAERTREIMAAIPGSLGEPGTVVRPAHPAPAGLLSRRRRSLPDGTDTALRPGPVSDLIIQDSPDLRTHARRHPTLAR